MDLSHTPPPAITHDMILEATAEFLRREAADDYGAVVIARNVTLVELDEVPLHWFKHARIALRADGTLVITKFHGTAHGNTVAEVSGQVASYAGANGIDIGAGLVEFHNLQAAEPDVQLITQAVNPNDEIIARALFEVEFSHRSCPEIITMVTNYFTQLPALERVVVFKFFPPRGAQANRVQGTNDLRYLRVPAFLIVFRRIANAGPNDVPRIQVAQMRSFGNAVIETRALEAFATPPHGSLLEPFVQAEDHGGPAPRRILPRRFTLANLNVELHGTRARTMTFDVMMPAPIPAIRLDLVRIFLAAMRGWNAGRQADARRAAVAARRVAPDLAPAPVVTVQAARDDNQ